MLELPLDHLARLEHLAAHVGVADVDPVAADVQLVLGDELVVGALHVVEAQVRYGASVTAVPLGAASGALVGTVLVYAVGAVDPVTQDNDF